MTLLFANLLILAFFSTLYLTYRYCLYALKHSLVDIPSQRSSHLKPTPRGGGVSFVIVAALCAIAVLYGMIDKGAVSILLSGAVIVAVTGFLDDIYNLKGSVRFSVQVFTAVLFAVLVGGWPQFHVGEFVFNWGILGLLFAVLGIVWSINLFNFMDGIDGIASLEAIFVLLCGGLMMLYAGGKPEGLFSIIVATSVAGFLKWNLPPAKIFMGDVGSYFLGFLIAAFAIVGERRYGVPVLLWVILYGAFWFDATITLVRRLTRGEQWYSAHKSHAYQRLHQYGWSHGKVVAATAALNAILGIIAFAGFFIPKLLMPALITSVVFLAAVYLLIERVRPMYTKA